MLNSIFTGIFDSDTSGGISVSDFVLCLVFALLAGVILAFVFSFRSRFSRSFIVTLALLPAVVCVVIMAVNGNVGTGIAVAGAFSLVRFRSAPGTAKEIGVLFIAMGSGLLSGMGYLAYAILYTLILCAAYIIFELAANRIPDKAERFKTLHITIPEDLEYTEIFDDIFKKYAKSWKLTRVKTTNMGSMFRLTYDIELADEKDEQQMINEIRCRNGNLEISIAKHETQIAEL